VLTPLQKQLRSFTRRIPREVLPRTRGGVQLAEGSPGAGFEKLCSLFTHFLKAKLARSRTRTGGTRLCQALAVAGWEAVCQRGLKMQLRTSAVKRFNPGAPCSVFSRNILPNALYQGMPFTK